MCNILIYFIYLLSGIFACNTLALTSQNAVPCSKSELLTKAVAPINLTRRYGHRTHQYLQRRGVPTSSMYKRGQGQDYSFDILWGDRTLSVAIDTGSSDLWVASSNFSCHDVHHRQVPLPYCGFGQYVEPKFEHSEIENSYFWIEYGGGGIIKGINGFQDITIAGVQIIHQQVAIATTGHWLGDNATAGILGLSYPSQTSAYNGSIQKATFDQLPYKPWLFSAVSRGLISPMFSMALQRSANNEYAGQIAFGGLPDLKFSPSFTSAPMKIYTHYNLTHPVRYEIEIDGWVIDDVFHPERNKKYLIDSGNPGLLVSTGLAAKINQKFSPPANFTHYQYELPCNTTFIPRLAVRISGADFPIDPRDLIANSVTGFHPLQTIYCVSSVEDGGGFSNTLGDAFLRNVVAVFDIGAAEMRFAPHIY